jgi:hypothetical protein
MSSTTTTSSTTSTDVGYVEKTGTWVASLTDSKQVEVIGWLFIILCIMILSLIAIYGLKVATWNGFSKVEWPMGGTTPPEKTA